ncbi:hypothetical protein FANTH_7090 [Fusarium anthophilum]|uniref:Heterokaryon incompatibility domain-containing protein n=1 Tax=Fusarium anthophilum TaxID=48485 RepID=A0A8H4ZHQ1_9HYPO|nr:hypothetical protein FANTH_7090 [Fusarium anthophilum]
MSGLEIPAFIIGLGGLISVFEKGFEIWRVIRRADDFGDDIADWMCKLEMEFFRFQTWWTALEHIAITKKSSHSVLNVPFQSSPLQVTLDKQFGKPITGAATSILRLLEKIEEILQRNGVLVVMQAEPVVTDQGADLSEATAKSRQRLKRFASELLKHTPWTTRIKHSTSPWKEDSDKAVLDDSLESMIYWNNTLYSILPQNIRDSILELGIAGYALDPSENIKDIVNLSNDRNGTLSQSAKLMSIRQRFKDGMGLSADIDAILQQMELKEAAFEGLVAADVFKGCQYTISQYTSQDGQVSRALIEWIPIPKDFDAYKLAYSRMARISYTLQQIGTFSAIQPLPALGFVEFGGARSFGLVSTLPRSLTSSTKVYTLYDMLSGGQKSAAGSKSASRIQHALPSLNQRLQLASKLVMGFYTFLLTRWHHERFNSLHIAFLIDETDTKSKALDLSQPIIGGFAISRPDSPTELSISASVEDTEIVYLHPDIRKRLKSGAKKTGNEQRFQRVHDIYAVGLLLAEIGYWRPIAKVAESGARGSTAGSMLPEQFKEAVIKKCRSDLAFFAGETYRDITLRCLLAETVDINEAPDFDLISATWGNPDSADPGDIDEYGPMHLYPITINGKLMFLPKNIYEALKMAQKVNDPVEQRNELFLETELMTAVENNHRPKVQQLLEQGAHIHAQDCFGKTAIHHAAQLGHFDIINILLDYGGSMKVIDSYGKTPMDYITYTKPKDWENIEEIAYKMQKTPEERELVPVPEVVRVGRPIWIDAICIDQSNPEERSNHGSLIAQIYCQARSAIAWIGIQNDETKFAPEAISSILRADGKDPDETMSDDTPSTTEAGCSYIPSDQEKSSIIRFLRRSWFEREGLMHEVAFGRAITVYCGMDTLSFSSIMEFLRREAYSGTFLPSDLHVWSLIGNTGSNKRRSLESRSRTKRTRRDSIDG